MKTSNDKVQNRQNYSPQGFKAYLLKWGLLNSLFLLGALIFWQIQVLEVPFGLGGCCSPYLSSQLLDQLFSPFHTAQNLLIFLGSYLLCSVVEVFWLRTSNQNKTLPPAFRDGINALFKNLFALFLLLALQALDYAKFPYILAATLSLLAFVLYRQYTKRKIDLQSAWPTPQRLMVFGLGLLGLPYAFLLGIFVLQILF